MASMSGYRIFTESRRSGGFLSKEDLGRAIEYIQALYDGGTPFFTKENIRRIGEQLAEAARTREIRRIVVDGLDGIPVEFEVHVGRVSPEIGSGLESVVKFAFVHYSAAQHLVREARKGRKPQLAYCSLRIMHQVDVPSMSKVRPPQFEVETVFSRCRRAWDTSEQCRQLRETLTKATTLGNVSKIVGLACGRMAEEDPQAEPALRSATQHAILLTLQDIFKGPQEGESQIPCYVQDPAYTSIDKTILTTSGLVVLDDPMAIAEIDDESVLMSLYPNIPVKEIVRDIAKPALIIWQEDFDTYLPSSVPSTDPEGPRVKEWLREYYEELQFPAGGEHFGQDQVRMYVRSV